MPTVPSMIRKERLAADLNMFDQNLVSNVALVSGSNDPCLECLLAWDLHVPRSFLHYTALKVSGSVPLMITARDGSVHVVIK